MVIAQNTNIYQYEAQQTRYNRIDIHYRHNDIRSSPGFQLMEAFLAWRRIQPFPPPTCLPLTCTRMAQNRFYPWGVVQLYGLTQKRANNGKIRGHCGISWNGAGIEGSLAGGVGILGVIWNGWGCGWRGLVCIWRVRGSYYIFLLYRNIQ